MSREGDLAILEGLHALRPPPAGTTELVAEIVAALAIGLAVAALTYMLLRVSGAQAGRAPSRRATALARLEAARQLPEAERLLAQAHLLRDLTETEAPASAEPWLSRAARQFDLPDAALAPLRHALYRPGASPDLAALEKALTAAARRLRG